jgi:hypothetical protein
MKTLMIVAFAGALLTSLSAAGTNNQWSEERIKAKTGRYSPAEESRRAELARQAKETATECQDGCCRRNPSAPVAKRTEEFLRAKFGRTAAPAASIQNEEHRVERTEPSSTAAWERAKFGRSLRETADGQADGKSTMEVAVCHMCAPTSCCD